MLRNSISSLYFGLNCVNTRFLCTRLSGFCVNLTPKKFISLPIKNFCTAGKKSYYSVLGLKPDATDHEIKNAYYSLSKKYHPDLNVGNKSAESKILEINEAFEVLGNKVKKEKYDDKMFPKFWKNPSFYDGKEPKTEKSTSQKVFKYGPNIFNSSNKILKKEAKKKSRYKKQVGLYNKSQSSKILVKTSKFKFT